MKTHDKPLDKDFPLNIVELRKPINDVKPVEDDADVEAEVEGIESDTPTGSAFSRA